MPATTPTPGLSLYRGRRVLVTGCTGFKGSWLSLWLKQLGAEVSGLALDVPTEPALFEVADLHSQIDYHPTDVRDLTAVKAVIGRVRPQVVFHLAAQAIVRDGYADPVGTFATNVMGTAHVLEALRGVDAPCVVICITSDKCYRNVEWVYGYRETDALGGKDPYSASKAGAEMVIASWQESFLKAADCPLRVASARAGNVIGGGDWASARIVPDAVRAWSRGEPVQIRSPRATRPWQHVLEPLSGYLELGARLHDDPALRGEAFNFGPSAEQNHTVEELLYALAPQLGYADPACAVKVVPAPGFAEAGLLKLSCDKALAQLGWRAVLDFDRTARLTGSWYADHYRQPGADMRARTLAQIAEYTALARQQGLRWAQAA